MARLLVGDAVEWLMPGPAYLALAAAWVAVMVIRGRWDPGPRWRVVVLGLCAWLYLAATPAVANLALYFLESRFPRVEPAEVTARPQAAVVVLASGYERTTIAGDEVRLGEAGWERLLAGVTLWRRTGGTLYLVGQPAAGEPGSVAEVMARVARELGVPAARLRVDGRSSDTYENLLFLRGALEEVPGPVWIVSSAAHLPRAMGVAARLGIPARAYPCDYRAIRYWGVTAWIPANSAFPKLRVALHEYLGMLYYRLRGRI